MLILNIVVTVSAIYVLYINIPKTDYAEEARAETATKQEYLKFKKETYSILGQLMMGMQMMDANLLRVHHFVEPHSTKFYEGCQECNIERKEMLRDKTPPGMRKLQQFKLPSEGNYDTDK